MAATLMQGFAKSNGNGGLDALGTPQFIQIVIARSNQLTPFGKRVYTISGWVRSRSWRRPGEHITCSFANSMKRFEHARVEHGFTASVWTHVLRTRVSQPQN